MASLTRQSIRLISRQSLTPKCRNLSTESLPRILQPSLWRTITPKSLRHPNTPLTEPDSHTSLRSLLRNPAVHITMLAILCGSQAIHVLTLKTSTTDAETALKRKVTLLNDVIERIKSGEAVDVRKELGQGDEVAEREWKEVLDGLGDAENWLKESKKAPSRRKEQKKAVETTEFTTSRLWAWLGLGQGQSTQTTSQQEVTQTQTEVPSRPAFF
jgi:hypothetical protein